MPHEGVSRQTGFAASLRAVHHAYTGRKGRVDALRGIDLVLHRGELTVLLGVNGSGKSTLLRLLAAVLRPTSGDVDVLGRDTAQLGSTARRRLRSRVAYVGQDAALDPEMYVLETLELLATLYGVTGGRRTQRVGELSRAFGLDELLTRRVDELSGGQRRRLHLAAGLVHEPELVLLDEPAAGLDAPGTEMLWRELHKQADDGRAVVLVSHELEATERHADRAVLLEAGRLVADAAPAALLAEHDAPNLAEAFRRLTGHDPAQLAPRAATRGLGKGKGKGKGRGP